MSAPEKARNYFSEWRRRDPVGYMKAMGFTKNLTYYEINIDERDNIWLQEYDFYADDFPCLTCNSRESIWFKIEHGTITKTCIVCRKTVMMASGRVKPTAERRTISATEAENILRKEHGLNSVDLDRDFPQLRRLLRVVPRVRPEKRRPRPPSKRGKAKKVDA